MFQISEKKMVYVRLQEQEKCEVLKMTMVLIYIGTMIKFYNKINCEICIC